jgi:hypothetical protein
MARGLQRADQAAIDGAVEHYLTNRSLFEGFAQALVAYFTNAPALAKYIHFIKYRVKDPENLRGKLVRKRSQRRIDQ